jgi:hypothetical protein
MPEPFSSDAKRVEKFTKDIAAFLARGAKGFPMPPGAVKKPYPYSRVWESGPFKVELFTRATSKPGFGKIYLYFQENRVGTLRIDSAPIEEMHAEFDTLKSLIERHQAGE